MIEKVVELMTVAVKSPASALGVIALLALLTNILWTEGRIPGVIGYAKADEIEQVKAQVAAVQAEVSNVKGDIAMQRREGLETALFNTQIEYCKLSADQTALRTEFQRRISGLQSDYRQLTATGSGTNRRLGDPYPLPEC